MTPRREPVLGPNALAFAVLLGLALALRLWWAPPPRGRPDFEFRHLAECGPAPPPPGVVYVCQSSARP